MGTAAAFLACYCPLCLSAPGKPSDPGIPSEFLPAEPGIQQGASRRSHVLMHVDPRDALMQYLHACHLPSGHPRPDTDTRAARQSPGQNGRLTHAHAEAAGVTRQGAPAPIYLTATNGPQAVGHDGRHALRECTFQPLPYQPRHREKPRPADNPQPARGGRDPVFIRHGRAPKGRMGIYLGRPPLKGKRLWAQNLWTNGTNREKNRLCAISLKQMPASVPERVYAHLVSVRY